MEKNSVSRATLGRLPRYLQYLKEIIDSGDEFISATTIAKGLSLGEVQVRKDLNAVSGAGKPKVGYETYNLKGCIEKVLGYNNLTGAVIVGAGKLGRALLNYDGFREFGVEIVAAFDINVKSDEDCAKILPADDFNIFCKDKNIQIGIITVNEASAQEVCDKMVESGIRAIWNFTPKKLCVPEDVVIQQENLALSLAHLSNQLSKK